MEINVKINVTSEIVNNVLVCALEGGSNYWYMLGDFDRKHFVKGEPLVDNLTRSFDADDEYRVQVLDLESVEYDDDDEGSAETLGYLTNESMAYAFSTMAVEFPEQFARIMTTDCDADDADIWFQIAVMGEITFG